MRDPNKRLRNQRIAEITGKLKELLPEVLAKTDFESEQSLHGTYGGKNDDFIDIKNEIILSPTQFKILWIQGYTSYVERLGEYGKESAYYQNYLRLQRSKLLQEYVFLFLERTYLRYYESLSRRRPSPEEAIIWIGQERASYGILVTPRFNGENWENDESEIRHFRGEYWTIAHILKTGLVIPYENDRMTFNSVEEYLNFFKNVLVRSSGSKHETEIANRYCSFVRNSSEPERVPLLIHELRYGGIERNHQYRLDFCVIDPNTMGKIGFELSPWSTHGELKGLKGLTQAEINRIAQANFEKEMRKHKAFFKKYGVFTLIYTDTDLNDPDSIFEDIKAYLLPDAMVEQLEQAVMEEFLSFHL